MRVSLTLADGMMFFDNRLVVPSSLRPFFLARLHEGHLGVEKTKRLVRESVFWPGISAEIAAFVQACDTCQKFARNNVRAVEVFPISLYLWQQVTVNIATHERKDYLVVVDKYSNWPEVVQLSSKYSKSAPEIVLHLKNLFARHCVPESVIVTLQQRYVLGVCQGMGLHSYFYKPPFPAVERTC